MCEEFLKCQLGFLGNTDGSAYLSQGRNEKLFVKKK